MSVNPLTEKIISRICFSHPIHTSSLAPSPLRSVRISAHCLTGKERHTCGWLIAACLDLQEVD